MTTKRQKLLNTFLSQANFKPKDAAMIQNYSPETIKIAVIGSGGIGKSALSLQYVQSLFNENYDPTLQDYYCKKALIFGQYVNIEILDTAGQDEYSLLRSEYLRHQDGFLLCFSLEDKSSFNNLDKFYKEIYRSTLSPGEAKLSTVDLMYKVEVPLILVGNKSDLRGIFLMIPNLKRKSKHTGY